MIEPSSLFLISCGTQELFSEIGDLKRSTVHYDRSGRSKVNRLLSLFSFGFWNGSVFHSSVNKNIYTFSLMQGTAEVVYSRRADAVAASKRYNNVQLDGKPMKIEIIGTNLSIPAPPVRATNGTASAGRGGQAPKEP